MEYLFDRWTDIEKQFKKAEQILLLLDYDGTLSPIVNNPDIAFLPSQIKKILSILVKTKNIKVAVISGRSLSDIRAKVAIDGIWYAGNHGLEIEQRDYLVRKSGISNKVNTDKKNIRFVHPQARKTRPMIQKICRTLEEKLSSIPGVLVENKGFTLSVHYRLVKKSQIPEVKRILSKTLNAYIRKKEIKVSSGKMILEIRPPLGCNKGEAVVWILNQIKQKTDYLPIYLGDDRTDEDAFRTLPKSGISIYVGKSNSSQAKYFLRDVTEVGEFLERIKNLYPPQRHRFCSA